MRLRCIQVTNSSLWRSAVEQVFADAERNVPIKVRRIDCVSVHALESTGERHVVLLAQHLRQCLLERLLHLMVVEYEAPPGRAHEAMSFLDVGECLQGRDARERALDARNRLERGRMLLVFLGTDEALRPVRIRGVSPKTVDMTLVRLQLPDDL